MRVKIISDGTREGTRVVNSETGETLRGVSGVRWRISDITALATATIELDMVEVELEADAEVKAG